MNVILINVYKLYLQFGTHSRHRLTPSFSFSIRIFFIATIRLRFFLSLALNTSLKNLINSFYYLHNYIIYTIYITLKNHTDTLNKRVINSKLERLKN